VNNHSSRPIVTNRLKQPTRTQRGPRLYSENIESLFGLAPSGVFPATCVTTSAVRSYRTFSPLLFAFEALRLLKTLSPSVMYDLYTSSACSFSPTQNFKCCENTLKSGIFSVALSVGSRLPGVTWHFALWSPDFPLYLYTLRL
jgi:hypothetical protein